ncbi:MAG: Zn-dependent hydrolase, partial [Anaerolineae bacterium]
AGGVSRPAMSPADVEGRAWFRARVEAAGLQFRQDGAGNLSAILPADDPGTPTLLVGSHLDSVPNGGRFDGALGVLAALESLRTIKEASSRGSARGAGLRLPVHLEAISFTDEEGAVLGLLGSQAVAGQLTPEHLDQARGGQEQLEAGLRRLSITRQSILTARRDPAKLIAFVELHIEQGTRLEEAGIDIGVVTSIVGIRSHWLRFVGQAAHAGTTPMDRRADALWGATAFMQRARDLVMTRFSPGVMNCGQLHVQPGAFNIVPAEVRLALEFRHGTESQLDEMEHALFSLAEEVAREHGLTVEAAPADHCLAAPLDEDVMQAIERATTKLGLRHARLVSFAGHDTQAMSRITPSAMLFVPSVAGISHNPREFTRPEDVVNGANSLLHTLLELGENSGLAGNRGLA